MSLEELLQMLTDAKAKAAAAPDDKELADKVTTAQAAYDAKKAEEDAKGSTGGNPDDLDETKLDEKTKSYLAKLRKENASHRTKSKDLASQLKSEKERKDAILKAAGIEVETEKPEEKIRSLSAEKETIAFRNAILESAVQNGIAADGIDFYEFLVAKETASLQEGEELTDEKLKEIVLKVKKQTSKGAANSTVTGSGGNPPPPEGGAGQVTFEKFLKMSISEKSELYLKNKDLYVDLMNQAKSKKKLVG